MLFDRTPHTAALSTLAVAALVASCAPQRLAPREGLPVPQALPQAVEQCEVQPELDWCEARARARR